MTRSLPGTCGFAYHALARWVERIRAQPWEDAFVFFKYTDEARAPALAQAMAGLV